jgi:hypothetical protein
MPIDSCSHTFEDLVATVLPAHYARLEAAVQNPIHVEKFVGPKSATKAALAVADRSADFPGCYVFIDETRPVYVGISRGVVNRIVQHVNFESHYSASLVYRMATDDYPHEMKRDQAMKDDQFRNVFLTAQGRLREMSVAFIQVDNDVELYMLEVMAAMRLDTGVWNSFRTH